jgi:hypothetical protein
MVKKKSKTASPFVGRWDIVSMSGWSEDVINEEVPAYIEFEDNGSGRFQFIYVKAEVDYDEGTRDGKPSVDFSWEGFDEMDEASGRGHAVLEGDELRGLIAFHQGDRSDFLAKRSAGTKTAKTKASVKSSKPPKAILPIAKGKAAKGTKAVKGPAAKGKVYQLKITLKDIKPPIWRRVLVPDRDLELLHFTIQEAMGWQDCHLHEFEIDGQRYTDAESASEMESEIDADFTLGQLIAKEKTKFTYNYDFGDDWRHEIVVEKILPPGEGVAFPICVDGKRACPPEDCGGPWGYMEFAEAIHDPKHERHREFLEWRGEFDPEAFDSDAVNKELRRLQ